MKYEHISGQRQESVGDGPDQHLGRGEQERTGAQRRDGAFFFSVHFIKSHKIDAFSGVNLLYSKNFTNS